MYETIQSPINYGGLPLKNRIIFAPTSLGLPQPEQIERLRNIAAGGCAMIILGDVPVLPHGFGPSLYSKKGMAYYKSLTDAVHQEGCKICAQLHQSDSNWKAMIKYIPKVLTHRISMEELRPLLNQQVGPYITNLPVEKNQRDHLRLWHGRTAGRPGGIRYGPGPRRPDVRQLQLCSV